MRVHRLTAIVRAPRAPKPLKVVKKEYYTGPWWPQEVLNKYYHPKWFQFKVDQNEVLLLDKDPNRAAKCLWDEDLKQRLDSYLPLLVSGPFTRLGNKHWFFSHYYYMIKEARWRGLISDESAGEYINKCDVILGTYDFSGLKRWNGFRAWYSVPTNRFIDIENLHPYVGRVAYPIASNRRGYLLPGRVWTRRTPPLWFENNKDVMNAAYEKRN